MAGSPLFNGTIQDAGHFLWIIAKRLFCCTNLPIIPLAPVHQSVRRRDRRGYFDGPYCCGAVGRRHSALPRPILSLRGGVSPQASNSSSIIIGPVWVLPETPAVVL